MLARFRFRFLIAITGTIMAEAFAAVGLWQRNHILSQSFFMGTTLWESTARFHVWPWPYRFAAILALPAFIGGSMVMLPFRLFVHNIPEAADLLPTAALSLLLWYWVASKLEAYTPVTRWTSLCVFLALSLAGAFLPLGYTGWLIPYGALAWCIAAFVLRRAQGGIAPGPSFGSQ
jgi:hypothetical protein